MSIHIALCAGQSITLCDTCARHRERYTPDQQAANPGRITPTTDGHRCAAWRYAPAQTAVTPTNVRNSPAGGTRPATLGDRP